MRFDDRLSTILRQPCTTAAAVDILWSQIIDVLTQQSSKAITVDMAEVHERAFEKLETLHKDVSIGRRQFMANIVADRAITPRIALYFGQDIATVCAPVMAHAQLSETDWFEIIPKLPSSAQALLRERGDLSEPVMRLLHSYSESSFTPSASEPSLVSQISTGVREEPAPSQIRDLVARIEAFKKERLFQIPQNLQPVQAEDIGLPQANIFYFETNNAGIFCWIKGAPRGALIGISLAEMAAPRLFGVDGHASGAYHKRSTFRDAQLVVPGIGPASGKWLISGDPLFNPAGGRFLGYRGLARRQKSNIHTDTDIDVYFGRDIKADSMRQLVHELRTPLNAIHGFSEMMNAQLLGPASLPYRDRAGKIIANAAQLACVVEDLDLAASFQDEVDLKKLQSRFDFVLMVETLVERLRPLGTHHKAPLIITSEPGPCLVELDHRSTERVIERFINLIIGLAEFDETVVINICSNKDQIEMRLDKPRCLDKLANVEHVDFVAGGNMNWPGAPVLGLDFTIRLIKQMAKTVGGHFKNGPDRFILILPSVNDTTVKTKESY